MSLLTSLIAGLILIVSGTLIGLFLGLRGGAKYIKDENDWRGLDQEKDLSKKDKEKTP